MNELQLSIQEQRNFKQLATAAGFTGKPLRIKGKVGQAPTLQLTEVYKKFVKTNPTAPLPTTLVFNPITNRIVKRENIYTGKGKVQKKYKDTLVSVQQKLMPKNVYETKRMQAIEKMQIRQKYKQTGRDENYRAYRKQRLRQMKVGEEIAVKISKYMDNLELFLADIDPSKQYRLNINGTFYWVNDANKQSLINTLKVWNGETTHGSDEELLDAWRKFDEMIVERVEKGKKTKGSKFWKWYNDSHIELQRYGIFKTFDKRNYRKNCFIYALNMSFIPDQSLSKLETMVFGKNVRERQIKHIATELGICIEVKRQYDTRARTIRYNYQGKDQEIVRLGSIDDHYFINELMDCTMYHIKNPKSHTNSVSAKDRKNHRGVMSFEAIQYMFENHKDYFIPMPNADQLKTIYANELNNIEFQSLAYNNWIREMVKDADGNLKCNAGDLQKIKLKNPPKDQYVNWFADFESIPFDEHNAWCCVCKMEGQPPIRFTEWSSQETGCGYEMMHYIRKTMSKMGDKIKPRIIFHNLTYDWRFIQLIKGVNNSIRGCFKDGKVYYASCRFYGMECKFECSLLKMGMCIPLSKFKKNFKIEQEKDICPYKVYTFINLDKQYVALEECLTHLRPSEKDTFIKRCGEHNLLSNGKVDIINYGLMYCVKDVEVLEQGYNKYKQLLKELNKDIDLDNYTTLASIAENHLIFKGAYEDVYKLSGVPQQAIQKCVVGGRTMMRDNMVQKAMDTLMACLDCSSLYPTAISELGANGNYGYLKGAPKIIPSDMTFETLKEKDGYFVLIHILDLPIKRHMALTSFITEDGIRYNTNEVIGKRMWVDRFSLEDMVEFQGLKFEIIQGYYFDEGRNPAVGDAIRELYSERKKAKARKDPIQLVHKLILNTPYGRTILRATPVEVKFQPTEQAIKYCELNREQVICWTPNKSGNITRIEEFKDYGKHFNSAHIGAEILGMSKRIMNRVMCLAEDLGIRIEYTDTDSCWLEFLKINQLAKQYKEKYGKEMVGTNLGEFHNDFDSDILDKQGETENLKEGDDYDVVAVNAIWLNKKDYCAQLKGRYKDGTFMKDQSGNDIVDYKIGCKGMPTSAIYWECHKRKITPLELYEERLTKWKYGNSDLSRKYQFNTMKLWDREKGEEYHRVSFEMQKNMSVITRTEMVRAIGCGAF